MTDLPEEGISRKTIEKVSKLARLELSREEIDRYEKDLTAIVGHIEQLKKLDLKGVEPLNHAAEQVNVFREDIPAPSLSKEKALENAPESTADFFVVPKIIE